MTRQQPANHLNIWALTSGAAGMRSQALGLAHAILSGEDASPQKGTVTEIQIDLHPLWRLFPGHLTPVPLRGVTKSTFPLKQPWPDLLLTCGRRASSISIAIGKESGNKTYRVHIQDPKTPPHYFDLIAAMQHDTIRGENVVLTKTALHKITAGDLSTEASKWRDQLYSSSDQQILGVIIGGKNKKFGFNETRLNDLIHLIDNAATIHNRRVLITPSRRTEPFVKTAISELAEKNPNIWLWDETGDNPYLAILGLSDSLCVTADSVSMISECLYTGKSVHIFPLDGTSRRHSLFINQLLEDNLAILTRSEIDFSVHARNRPIDETAKVADIIRQNMALTGNQTTKGHENE